RIVNHVRDPIAQRLAWPGLVVRRVTKEIVRELLAKHCGIRPEDAERAFTALSQEVWMVYYEGEALRHRPDLRARTLPLMRQKGSKDGKDGETFLAIARDAIAYFAERRQLSKEDNLE